MNRGPDGYRRYVEPWPDGGIGAFPSAVVAVVKGLRLRPLAWVNGLHERARTNLRHFRLATVHLMFGDGMVGYAKGAPYAGIIAAAGGEAVPEAWIEQLAVGGRIVAPTRGRTTDGSTGAS